MTLKQIISDPQSPSQAVGYVRVSTIVKNKQITAIVVYKLDRLSRSVLDTLKFTHTVSPFGCTYGGCA
ncbi:MAG: recombinase family protein [Nitrospirae bacterium]|nr:recombinase family protein [Nitrospirota bacterium]